MESHWAQAAELRTTVGRNNTPRKTAESTLLSSLPMTSLTKSAQEKARR